MAVAIIIFGYISNILFTSSFIFVIFRIKEKCDKNQIYLSNFSILCCLLYNLISFIYYYQTDEGDSLIWTHLISSIISLILLLTYIFYYVNIFKEKKSIFLLLYILAIIDIVIEVILIERDLIISNKKDFFRIVSFVFNALMYIIPGNYLIKAILTHDFGYFYIYISIFGVFNSFIMLLYGIINDFYKKSFIISNSIGLALSFIQIFLYIGFKYKYKVSNFLEDIDDKEKEKEKKIERKLTKEEKEIIKERRNSVKEVLNFL